MTAQRADASGVNDFWHYAVGSEKRGPVARTTIAKLLASGEISSETYVWQPGMENWVHLGDAAPLKSLVAALDGDGQPEEFVEEDTTFTPVSEVKAAHQAMAVGIDLDEEEELSSDTIVESVEEVTKGVAALSGATYPAREAAKAEPSVAPAASAAPFGAADDDIFGSGPESQDEGPVGVHARRQSSVLFKLDELGRDESQKSSENQQFLTDSSGLIDIRAIATAEKKSSPGDDPFGAPFPAAGGLNVEPRTLSTPLSMPIVERRRGAGPWILAAVALLVAGGVALALILGGDKTPPPQAVAPVPPTPVAPPVAQEKPVEAAKVEEPKPTTPEPEAKPAEVAGAAEKAPEGEQAKTEGEAKAEGAEAGEKVAEAAGADAAKAAGTPSDAAVRDAKAGAAAAKTERPRTTERPKADPPKAEAKVEVAPAREQGSKENTNKVNDLLNRLNEGEKSGGAQVASGNDSLPDKLSAASVRNAIRGRFARCGSMIANPSGSVTVQTQFVISSSGVVQSANVTDGGGTSAEVQRCVVGVIRETSFGRFKEPTMQVNLPVRLL